MNRTMCKSKIHGVIVREANLNYVGSLTIDRTLMEVANIAPFEWLYVVNVTNGARFETYAIEGEGGSGMIALNGAAARLGQVGDKVIIMCSAQIPDEEIHGFVPKIVFVDEHNRIAHPSVGDRRWPLEATRTLETEMNDALRAEMGEGIGE